MRHSMAWQFAAVQVWVILSTIIALPFLIWWLGSVAIFIAVWCIPDWHDPPPGWTLGLLVKLGFMPWTARRAWYDARKHSKNVLPSAMPALFIYMMGSQIPEVGTIVEMDDEPNATVRSVITNTDWIVIVFTTPDPRPPRRGGNARRRLRNPKLRPSGWLAPS